MPSLTSPRMLFNIKISILAMAALSPLLSSAAIVNVCHRSCQKLDVDVN